MTLGIAARSSITNDSGSLTHEGASSDRKMAMPTLPVPPIPPSMAASEKSALFLRIASVFLAPCFCASIPPRMPSSSWGVLTPFPRAVGKGFRGFALEYRFSLVGQGPQGLLVQRDDARGQRSVVELISIRLAVVVHYPPNEVDESLGRGLVDLRVVVVELLVDQDVRETRYGIRVRAWSIENMNRGPVAIARWKGRPCGLGRRRCRLKGGGAEVALL